MCALTLTLTIIILQKILEKGDARTRAQTQKRGQTFFNSPFLKFVAKLIILTISRLFLGAFCGQDTRID